MTRLSQKTIFAGCDRAKPVWLVKPLPPKNKSAMAVISLYCLNVLEIEELVRPSCNVRQAGGHSKKSPRRTAPFLRNPRNNRPTASQSVKKRQKRPNYIHDIINIQLTVA